MRDLFSQNRQHAQHEGRVGGHGDAPPGGAPVTYVHREEEQHRHRHRHQTDGDRQHESPTLTQVTEIELATRLQADNEEEQGHQTAVHPATQVIGDGVVAKA